LASGIAVQAVLGFKRGGLLVLVVCSTTIIIKQSIGAWTAGNLNFNLLEVFLMAGTFILVGRFNDTLQVYFKEFDEAKKRLKILDLEDTSVGLIRSAIGLLRLKEESERAIRFKRPLTFILILVTILPEWNDERQAVMRSIATTVKDTTRMLDIPFILSENKIGLILTNTEINGTNTVIGNIQQKLLASRVITRSGTTLALQKAVQIRIGYAVFLGAGEKAIDLLDAAERSLQRNVEMNDGTIFQNLFIEWETLGEMPLFQTIFPSDEPIIGTNGAESVQSVENTPSH
jgi:hypothetical protein